MCLNSIIVISSLTIFGYTFFAKAHIVEHTRAFVTEKTLAYSMPAVELMRVGLETRLSQRLLSEPLRAEISNELSTYDSNPTEYIKSLTSNRVPDFGDGRVADFKKNVHGHYQSILEALVRDLRIFSGSNMVAGLFAIYLLRATGGKDDGKVIAFSFIVFAAVAFSSYSYFQGVSFLRILLNTHLGWWYPVGVMVTIIGLVLDYGLHKEHDDKTPKMP